MAILGMKMEGLVSGNEIRLVKRKRRRRRRRVKGMGHLMRTIW